MSKSEQPDYKLILSKGNIEIRDYPFMIVAEVEVAGQRREAIREGFKKLAGYIFGNNVSQTKMAMTIPVMQQKDRNAWKVRFVMAKKYTMETLPKANGREVVLVPLEKRRFAVIRFAGTPEDEKLKRQTEKLEAYIASEKLICLGEPMYAFYNPPWTLPFLRRNEVMMEIRNS